MGDRELVPRRVDFWAYGGDSIAQRGYLGRGNLGNTDIAAHINQFTGGKIQIDNFGRSHDTTSGILGKHAIRGKKKDSLGRMLEGDYEGIILEIGVNDLGGAGSRDPQVWAGQLGRMRRNVIEMYMRAYLKGAGTQNREEVLARINQAIAENEMELEDVKSQLSLEKNPVKILSLEDSKEFLEGKKQVLKEIRQSYRVLSRKRRVPKKAVKRIVFVEVAPWKPESAGGMRAEQKALHTIEYNAMLREVGFQLNGLFGRETSFEVAQIYDALGSQKDGQVLHPEYVGKKLRGRADYLHFGEEGRRAAAAAITLQIFPEYAEDKLGLRAITTRNKTKGQASLARR